MAICILIIVFEFFFDSGNQPVLPPGIDFFKKSPINRAIGPAGPDQISAAIRIINDVIAVFFFDILYRMPVQGYGGSF